MQKALFPILLVATIASASAGFSCGGSGNPSGSFSNGGAGGATSASNMGSGAGGSAGGPIFTTGAGAGGPYSDFPKAPIVDASAPKNAPDLFDGASGAETGGPCLVEPEVNALFPNNWLRPRFRWVPTGGENLFELTLHTKGEVNDLVVYTANPSWTMDKTMWHELASHVEDTAITMTIRGANWDGTTLTALSKGSTGPMTIAPAGAGGAVVYWTTSNGSSLKGFQVGDESVATTLVPNQVTMKTSGGADVTCIGCHTSTPDGKYVGITAQGPWGNALASVETATIGQPPPFMGAGAITALENTAPLGIQAYSKAHWSNGDHLMLAPMGDSPGSKLVVVDLEATDAAKAIKVLDRGTETSEVGAPTWSHDGKTIVYAGGDGNGFEETGRIADEQTRTDLFSVPFAGGNGKPIKGASDPDSEEFYPSFSPDDQLLAFNRVPSGTNMYNQPKDELYVVPLAGGTSVRLDANDPPMCSGKVSPGITNAWPKWSPTFTTLGTKKYYFLVFSSTRSEAGNPQLYMTGVIDDGGKIQTFGSVYLWNQPSDEDNHTPAWDNFKIPPSVPH